MNVLSQQQAERIRDREAQDGLLFSCMECGKRIRGFWARHGGDEGVCSKACDTLAEARVRKYCDDKGIEHTDAAFCERFGLN